MSTAPKIHRYQPHGYTPCGLSVDEVLTNKGKVRDDGVTCKRCRSATTRFSYAGAARNDDGPRSSPDQQNF